MLPVTLAHNADSTFSNAYNATGLHNFFSGNQDVIYEISSSAFTGGTLDLYFWWTPISSGAVATAGDGS